MKDTIYRKRHSKLSDGTITMFFFELIGVVKWSGKTHGGSVRSQYLPGAGTTVFVSSTFEPGHRRQVKCCLLRKKVYWNSWFCRVLPVEWNTITRRLDGISNGLMESMGQSDVRYGFGTTKARGTPYVTRNIIVVVCIRVAATPFRARRNGRTDLKQSTTRFIVQVQRLKWPLTRARVSQG